MALEFPGTSSAIRAVIPGLGATLNGLTALTVSLWVKSDVTNTDRGVFICEEPVGDDSTVTLRYDVAGFLGGGVNLIKIGVTVGGTDQNLESSSNTQSTDWHHLLFTWSSGNQLALYIDGELDTPTANQPAITGSLSGNGDGLIGVGGKGNAEDGWDGLVSDFRIYDRVLNAAEVSTIWATAGLDGLDEGLLFRLRLDDLPVGQSPVGAGSIVDITRSGFNANPTTPAPTYAGDILRFTRRVA